MSEPQDEAAGPAIPAELASALAAEPEAARRFWSLPPSHRRAYVEWIEEAKRPETRVRRAAKAVSMLLEHERRDALTDSPGDGEPPGTT